MLQSAERAVENKVDTLFGQREDEVSLLDLVIVLVRYWRSLVYGAVVGAVVGGLLCVILPPRYVATTSILPPQQGNSSVSNALMSQLGGLGSLAGAGSGISALKNPNDLQISLLKSRTVEDAVIRRFHLDRLYHAKDMTRTRRQLEKRVLLDNGAKDGLIRLSVDDRDKQRAAEIANGYIDEFRKFTATLAFTEASQRRLFFEAQLEQAKDKLADAEEDLKRTGQQTGVIQLEGQDRAAISSLAQLRAQIAAKEVEIHGMESFAAADNPNLQQAQRELSALRAQAEGLGSAGNEASAGFLLPKGILQEAGLKYVRKLREVKYRQELFDLLAKQYEIAKVDEARQGAFVQVVDLAVAPDQRSFPKPTLMIPAFLALGLFVMALRAIVREALARLSSNPEEHSRLETLRSLTSRSSRTAD